ncbi:V-type ATP synthase subunit D [Candidatus Bathyarchaeota archaeon]|nr:V-type ATP synthase subunit D [Candidatus Bathyarchaeota archaeon]MBS7617148.1 V-type ATP synthase subunit D [Candidatus Bathyarchaeota archaeon]
MATVELTAVPITREGLLKLRKRRTLALAILDLLQRDLDTLVKRFFSLVNEADRVRGELYDSLSEAYKLLSEAKAVLGSKRLKELSLSEFKTVFDVKVKEERMLGVRLISVWMPSMELAEVGSPAGQYDIFDTSAVLDEAVLKARDALRLIVKLAEINASIDGVVRAMQTTRRRINLIQYRFIPQIDNMMKYIESILEERAREDAVRLRILQGKRKGG